jgi:hypothetical protein
MNNGRILASLAWIVAVAALGAATLTGQALERSLHVSVLDRGGNVVSDLGPSDFVVREDKVAREVLRVRPAADPMQIALLVDDSQAAEEFIPHYHDALPLFVKTIMADGAPRHQEIGRAHV